MKRILVVDDEPDICSNLSDILLDFGFSVDACTSARDALRKVDEQPYDLAVLDLRMPEMDGVELCRRIKACRPTTMAILVTAYAEQHTADSATRAGIREIVPKPVDVPTLLHAIDQTQ